MKCEICDRSPKGSLLTVKDDEGFRLRVCIDCFEEFDDLILDLEDAD